MKNWHYICLSLSVPFFCSTPQSHSSVPTCALAVPSRAAVVKDGRRLRRPPHQRREASLTTASTAAHLACRAATSHFRFPCSLRDEGSGSGKPIKYRPRNPIKQRAHAHRPPCTHAPTRPCRLFQNSDDGADALTEASNAVVDLIQAGKSRCGRAGRARSPHPLSQTRMMATTGSAWSARPATIAARPPTTTAR